MKKSFRWRIFISFGLFITLFMMLVSGVILYISPPGRVANWTDWRFIGLTKTGWRNQHLIFGFAFLLLSLFHLFLVNWKVFLCYIKTKTAEGVKRPTELFAILLLSSLFGVGTYYGIAPFSEIIQFGNRMSSSWEGKAKQAPIPHAELMTLVELSQQLDMGGDPEALKTKLEKAGLKVASSKETLAAIAEANGMAAEKVYEMLAPGEKGSSKLSGKGFGRKTLQQIADESGVSATSLQLALRQKGIEAKTDIPLKTIVEENGIELRELRQLLETMISR
jgi:DNA-binding phage protein